MSAADAVYVWAYSVENLAEWHTAPLAPEPRRGPPKRARVYRGAERPVTSTSALPVPWSALGLSEYAGMVPFSEMTER